MKDYIEERAVEIANYIIENSATVRQTAKQFRISKSTVHKDVTERLRQINPSLAREARKVLDTNKSERHIRGGMATREKYLHQHGFRYKEMCRVIFCIFLCLNYKSDRISFRKLLLSYRISHKKL